VRPFRRIRRSAAIQTIVFSRTTQRDKRTRGRAGNKNPVRCHSNDRKRWRIGDRSQVGPIAEMESVSINRTAARLLVFRVGCDRRILRRRSARCEKRGVRLDQGIGVAKLGTDGPARRSRLLRPAWWIGPPPIPRCGPPRATNRMTRPPSRSPPQEAPRGFWIRAWSQRELALQGTGRSNDPAQWLGLIEGGLDDPRHSRQNQLASHRTPDPSVDVPHFGHSSVESESLSLIR
jgi:hypothetical protein